MQDELRQLQEAEGNQHAGGKKTEMAEMSKHSKAMPPVTAGHALKRTWSAEKDCSGGKEQKPTPEASSSSNIDRWLKESMREQPWHDIGAIHALPPSNGAFVMRDETGSNSAIAGSEQRKSSEFRK